MLKRIIVTVLLVCLAIGAVHAQRARDHIAEGQAHLQAQRFEQAIASFEAALRLEPRNRNAPALLRQAQEGRVRQLVSQAEALVREGKLTEAVAVYNSAIQAAPQGFNTSQITTARDRVNSTLREQQQQAERQQAQNRTEQSRQAVLNAHEHIRANKIAEAITGYENAVSIGGLNQSEASNAQRLITELKNIQTKMEAYNRPLRDDDFEVRQSGTSIEITGYKGSESIEVHIDNNNRHTIHIGIFNVVIPERLHGLQVTSVGGFRNKGITSVTFPNTVTSIGDFSGNMLERVTIPNRVTNSGNFSNNPLTEIVIPDSVTVIESSAFANCNLTSVTLGRGVQIIGGGAFRGNKLTNITFPAGLKQIWDSAFENNQIQSLTIPNGVELFSSSAIANNPLTQVVIPASLAVGMFSYSLGGDGMRVIRLGGGVNAFPDSLTRITMPANMDDINLLGFSNIPNFVNFYNSQNKAAGTYVLNGPI